MSHPAIYANLRKLVREGETWNENVPVHKDMYDPRGLAFLVWHSTHASCQAWLALEKDRERERLHSPNYYWWGLKGNAAVMSGLVYFKQYQ